MERPIFKPVGTPVEELDTPALVVDEAILDQNIEAMHSFFRDKPAKLRPHIESHRCPAIAHKQLAAGGTVAGVCVTTVGQAEVFARSGFVDVFVANLVVTRQKIDRLFALARSAKMTVAADNRKNVGELSEAASARGVALDVVVAINTGAGIFGVEPGEPAVDLARSIYEAEGVNLAGVMTYLGAILADDPETSSAESRGRTQQVLDTREMLESAGMDVGVVSVGGTFDYEIAGSMDGVTEVPAGSYALMDEKHRSHKVRFKPAARVLATVGSVPEEGVAITDGGAKAIGNDTGLPSVDNVPGATVKGLSAEHGSLALDASADGRLELGDKVWYTPWDIGTCVNLHDYINVVRDGSLVGVWDILARGHYR
jgi:D-serine deaminase-like pyridoxal phosphate-dependent protein